MKDIEFQIFVIVFISYVKCFKKYIYITYTSWNTGHNMMAQVEQELRTLLGLISTGSLVPMWNITPLKSRPIPASMPFIPCCSRKMENEKLCYVLLSYLILSYIVLSCLVLSYLILSYHILSYLMSSYLILCHLM